MNKQLIKKELQKITRGSIYENEPLSRHNTLKVGGPANILVEPANKNEFINLIKYLADNSIKYYVLGNGSNILFMDRGFPGVIVKTKKLNATRFNVSGEVIAEAGTLLSVLAIRAVFQGFGGLEELAGIPGTVGGAIRQNAGAFGREIKDILVMVEAINEAGNKIWFAGGECDFGYRTSRFKTEKLWITEAKFKLLSVDKNEALIKIEEYRNLRKEKQPLEYPNAGSIFKNSEGIFAGKLIEEAGLAGLKKGGAEISTKHANFIVNKGNVTASDILYKENSLKAPDFSHGDERLKYFIRYLTLI